MSTAADAIRDSFAVDFATLAREIAQDIFPVEQVVALHRLSDDEWAQIQAHPKFIAILSDMQRDWNSAASTKERVKIKAQTGLESQLEVFIGEISDARIPLTQRVEAGKFLARLGELDGATKAGGAFGERVQINIFTGADKPAVTIDAQALTADTASPHAALSGPP